MHAWQTNPDGSQTCEHGTFKMPHACSTCAVAPVVDEQPVETGHYEQVSLVASERGLPDRLSGEAILWDRHAKLMAIADAVGADADRVRDDMTALSHVEVLGVEARLSKVRAMRDLVAIRIALVGLQVKAIEAAGKDARHAATMILWRERKADAEGADRLYADRQRKVGRKVGGN
jgi:hypothetical protein